MKRALVILLLAQIVVGIAYSLATPIFEISDEIWHYPVVREIAVNRRLPVQDVSSPMAWAQEGSQPPLYYAIGALLTGWVDTSDYLAAAVRNPFAKVGVPLATNNKNMVAHPPGQSLTQGGTVLAVLLIRWLSVLMGTATAFLAYRLGLTIYPARPAVGLLTAALVAFNPMVLFINASVNNDNLVMLISTLTLLLLVRDVQSNEPGKRWGSTLLLGAILGLAAITKVSGLVLLPVAVLALALTAWPARAWKTWLWRAITVALVAAVIAGWWYVRNIVLYGEPTGLLRMVEVAGARPAGFRMMDLLAEWKGFWYSFWGVFGGFNVLAPPWFYALIGGLSLAAAVGLVLGLIRSVRRRQLPAHWQSHLLLIVFIALTFVGLVRWTLMTMASQGRLMFAAIAPIAFYLALGLLAWLPARWHEAATRLLAVGVAAVALAIPWVAIRPAYQPPDPIETLPAGAVALDVRCGDDIILAGYRLGKETVLAGQPMDVTLYWTATGQPEANLDLSLNGYGYQLENVAKLDTWPGGGLLPTSYWDPGVLYPDRYLLSTKPNSATPTLVKLGIAWNTDLLHPSQNQAVPCAAGGQSLDSLLLDAGVLVSEQPAGSLPSAPVATLQHDIQLLQAQTVHEDGKLAVDLTWQATGPVPGDYTAFAHLFDSSGVKVAQADAPPRKGYWPTSRWRPSEPVTSTLAIDLPQNLPPGQYVLGVGMYDSTSGQRLFAYKPDGSEWRDWVILLAPELALP